MRFSRQFKMSFQKVLIITLGYILLSLFLFLLNYSLLISQYSLGPSQIFSLRTYILSSVLLGLLAGTLGGFLLVLVNGYLFRKKSFRFALTTTLIAYILIFLFVTIVLTFVNQVLEFGITGLSISSMISKFWSRLDLILISNFMLWGIITLFTLFLIQVNDKFGPGILRKFLAGQYYEPKMEQRIFMFMDMRASTSIAEEIGNENYFNLLRDIYSDITNTILNYDGEIYQYVGDEVVISWPIEKGIKNANCLKCFGQIQKKLIELRPVYEKKYNVAPKFKAGIHYGNVMAGEIGVIKKDIIYSGDVLNTTARIQEQCNKYDVDILMSRETFDLIPNLSEFKRIPLGSIKLRGKNREVELSTISSAD